MFSVSLVGETPIRALRTRELTMRYFGTVKSFDDTRGRGSIQSERGHEEIGFERGAVLWRRSADPRPGQRLSYEVGIRDGRTLAVNLRTTLA